MKKVKNLSQLSITALLFSINAQAYDVPLLETLDPQMYRQVGGVRCTNDQLPDNEAAMKRIEWASNCGYVEKDAWMEEFTHKRDLASRKLIPRAKLAYPIFVHNDPANNYPIWIPDHSTCDRPANVTFLVVCEAGCYTPTQRIAFKDGYIPIKSALEKSKKTLMTLSPNSTLEKPVYKYQKEVKYISSAIEGNEKIRIIQTLGGGKLEVTPNHPILTSAGTIQEASLFRVGDSLVRADGSKDPIVKITDTSFHGKVYNLSPASSNPIENIVVAEGFLNGSQNYQSGDIKDLNRLLFRSIPSAKLLP